MSITSSEDLNVPNLEYKKIKFSNKNCALKKCLPSNFEHQVEESQDIHILCSNPYLHGDYNNHHHHIHIHNYCFHHHNNHPLYNHQLHMIPHMIYNVHRSFGNFPSSTHAHNIYQHNLHNQFSGDQYLDNLHFQYL